MNQPGTLLLALASIFLLGFPPLAHGAGDAARGSTLYHSTYSCTDCHSSAPTATDIVASGATAAGLLMAIHFVPPMLSRFGSTLANNPTDLADIAAYIASVISTAPAPDLDQHGLTGSWYEPATSGQGVELEVFSDLVAPGTGLAQGAWFTFDYAATGGAERQRWYTFSGNAQSGQPDISFTIYQNVGGNFDALPVTNGLAVGTGTLAFASCSAGTLTYSFSDGSGRTGTIPLTRLTPNVTCAVGTTPTTNADFGFSGNWYDPKFSGQGFVFEVNPLAPVVFFAWYTYAPSGQAAGAAGQRWYTGQAGYVPGTRTIAMTLYETTGGLFNTVAPAAQSAAVGTATVKFTSCAAAQLDYKFTGGSSSGASGTIPMARVGPVPPGCGP